MKLHLVAAATLILFAGFCDKPDCDKLEAAKEAACLAAPNSEACRFATQAYEEACSVTPEPTPEPSPTPTPSPEPTPEPTPPPNDYPGPTAAELAATGARVEIRPMREAGKQIGFTPFACFGEEYYCKPEVGWAEACNAGRRCGPVAPDGHPSRTEWEYAFMGQRCATFSYESQTHMSFDPYIVIGGVNQNHPRNVEVCKQAQFGGDPTWVKDSQGYIKRGQWSWATAHGNGEICAEAADGVGRTCKRYVE